MVPVKQHKMKSKNKNFKSNPGRSSYFIDELDISVFTLHKTYRIYVVYVQTFPV